MRKYELKKDIDFQNIKEILDFNAESYGDKTAIAYKTPDRKKVIEVSYKQMRRDIDLAAAYLLDKGLKGERIAVIGPNSYEWLVAYYGVLTSVGVVVPLDKGLTDIEIINSLRKCHAKAIVYDPSLEIDFNAVIAAEGVSAELVIPMNEIAHDALADREDLLEKHRANFKVIDNNAVDIILFTSGTTTDAKAAMLTQRNIASNVVALRKVEPIFYDDNTMLVLPFHHAFGSTGVLLYMSHGTTNVISSGLKYFQKEMAEFKITQFFCVPLIIEAMVNKVLKTADKEGKRAKLETARRISKFLMKFGIDIRRKLFKDVINALGGSLSTLISGAAPLSSEIHEYATDFGILVLAGYGLTETSPVVSAESYFLRRRGSVGNPMPGVEVKIVDPDEDGIGILYCRGENVMKGYLDDDEANSLAFDGDWFNTGDLARIDSDGFIYITGRKKNVIVLKNGKNVYPEEIEELINRLPYVSECVVSGQEKEDDYRIVATVVPNFEAIPEGTDVKALIEKGVDEINAGMPKYKSVREVFVRNEPFEKTTTQKIKRSKV